ncbi:MAG: DUF4198 domain-containing protein [Planctomycetes bacterium]|nr:DUF4198 domain-containing protein [Planctomycetota bacterium]
MIVRKRWTWPIAAAFVAVLVPVTNGQQVWYLAPQSYRAQTGQQISLGIVQGGPVSVQRASWPTEQTSWFYVRVAGTQQNRTRVQPADGHGTNVLVPLEHAGVTLIGLDSTPEVVEIAASQWRSFLARRSAPGAEPHRSKGTGTADKVRVRRVASAKTLVRVGTTSGEVTHSATAQSKTGQPAEIRPLADPTMATVGSDLPVRAYIDGGKKAGVRVLATNVAEGKTCEFVTDQTGAGFFRVSHPGAWRVEFHHAEPTINDPQADWVLYSATLTFEVVQEGAGK